MGIPLCPSYLSESSRMLGLLVPVKEVTTPLLVSTNWRNGMTEDPMPLARQRIKGQLGVGQQLALHLLAVTILAAVLLSPPH